MLAPAGTEPWEGYEAREGRAVALRGLGAAAGPLREFLRGAE